MRRNLAQSEASLDRLLDQLALRIQTGELTPEKRRERRAMADVSDLAFAEVYFPHVFTHPFSELHEHLASLEVGRYSVSGFPQSGKSAFTYLGKGVRKIALGTGGVFAVACRDLEKARSRTQALSRVIRATATLQYDYELEVIQDKAGYHIFKGARGTTHLVAGSVNTGVRNITDDQFNRITFAIADDLYDKESVRSELDNQRVFEWVTGELWRQLEDDGLGIFHGNSINDGCPIRLYQKAFPDNHFSFPIERDGEPTWPERYDREAIEAKRAETPSDVWHSEYLDDPLELGLELDIDWIHISRPRPLDIVASITAVDPAHGESPASCFKAAATLSILRDHRVMLTGIRIRREGYPSFFTYLREIALRTPRHKAILFENDFAQWAMAQPYYAAWLKQEETPLPIVRHHAKQLATKHRAADKESRILSLVHPHQTGLFLYSEHLEGSSDFEIYKRQYLGFGKHGRKKLDGLDAVATAYIMIRGYIETGGFKPLRQRRHKRPSWGGGLM